MIYLLAGPDYYLVARELRRILALVDPDGMNSTRYDKSTGLGEIESAVATMGFFGTGRVIVADGVMARASGAVKNKKAETGDILRLFSAIVPGNTLILVDPDLHSVPKAIESAAGTDAQTFVGKPPRGPALVAWVEKRVKELGGKVSRGEISYLLDRRFPGDWQAPNRNPQFDNPPDLQALNSELEKLSIACLGGPITAGDIDMFVSTETQDRLFPVLDAVTSGNGRESFRMLAKHGADDDASARLFNMLATNAELGQIAVLTGDSELAAISKQVGQSTPNRMQNLRRSLTASSVGSLAADVLEADRRLKTGKAGNPATQLHEVIIQRASKTRDR